ncbi:hypothetical protein TREES_T100011584 [Tupaia chinensis]|uniref:Uncharacterized protein n=1 Tax=Tupaia chinensis TaxID=246437 RepID=L9L7Y4_TUPCH|nr:hypothetical protein TREES_T100011584 [Tupaia chinensis]
MEALGRTRLGRREPPWHHLSPQTEPPTGLGLQGRSAPEMARNRARLFLCEFALLLWRCEAKLGKAELPLLVAARRDTRTAQRLRPLEQSWCLDALCSLGTSPSLKTDADQVESPALERAAELSA